VLDELDVGPHALDRLFTRSLRDGFALAASGTYSPFREVADGALATVAPVLTPRQRTEVLAAFARLDAQPDARPALERLARAGVPVAALTNGAATTTTALLERNGLDSLVERVISIDEVRTWKPARNCIGTPQTSWESNRVASPTWPCTAGTSTGRTTQAW
jgi:2-haloacid dehalogenase